MLGAAWLMNRPQALLTYDGLPISSGGAHRYRVRDHRVIWTAVSNFLQRCTTCDVVDDVHLVLYEGHLVEPRLVKALASTVQKYGAAERRLNPAGSQKEFQYTQYTWALSSEDISGAIDHMASLGPFPRHWLGGPMFLGIQAAFCLRDPGKSEPLPFQGSELYGGQQAGFHLPLGLSVIYLRLANPSTCALFLSLPFAEVTPSVRAYVRKLGASLPFKLSAKHWSRWQLNARGTRYYNRRASVLGDSDSVKGENGQVGSP